MAILARHPISVLILALAFTATAGAFTFARPAYHPQSGGVSIRLPDRQPAADATGAAGWVWPDGTPGWEAGTTIGGLNVSGVQPVELATAQLAAARTVLDASDVRVLVASRTGYDGVLAILAAPTLYETPARTCLAALLPGTAPVAWNCHLSHARVLVAASSSAGSLDLVGVARGDVGRVVLVVPGFEPQELYRRGKTWGQFESAISLRRGTARLRTYSHGKLVETLRLDVAPGQPRLFG